MSFSPRIRLVARVLAYASAIARIKCIRPETLKYWLVSIGVSLTSWKEGVSIALVGHPTSDVITIAIPYGVDVLLHRSAWHSIFSNWVD